MTAILQHELPMRWADLDELSHVNNVVYLDYADEARTVHVEAGDLPDAPARSVTVEFLRPMLLSRTPVQVRSSLEGDTLVQELGPASRPDTAFARVTTVHGPPGPAVDDVHDPDPFAVRVRRADLGPDGVVTTTKVFEYLQEARIARMTHLRDHAEPHERFVVAKVELGLGEPFVRRAEPYRAANTILRTGTSSFTVRTVLDGGRRGWADAVLVGFDLRTQRSRPLTDHERVVLAG